MVRIRTVALFFVIVGVLALAVGPTPVAQAQDEDPAHARLRERLEVSRVDLDFEDAPLADVLKYIQARLNVNILIDPKVWDDLDEDDTLITLTLRQMTGKHALNILMEFTGLAYTYKLGVIWVTTPERAYQGSTVVKIYDIRDLIMPINDFPGPKIRLSGNESRGGGQGLFFTEEEDPPFERPTSDEIMDLIPEFVAPDSWDEVPDTAIIQVAGLLIIRHTRDVHREVRGFLSLLRSNG